MEEGSSHAEDEAAYPKYLIGSPKQIKSDLQRLKLQSKRSRKAERKVSNFSLFEDKIGDLCASRANKVKTNLKEICEISIIGKYLNVAWIDWTFWGQ